jgi:hypothetical protein
MAEIRFRSLVPMLRTPDLPRSMAFYDGNGYLLQFGAPAPLHRT